MTRLVYNGLSSIKAAYNSHSTYLEIKYSKHLINVLNILKEKRIIHQFFLEGTNLRPYFLKIYLITNKDIVTKKFSWRYYKVFTSMVIKSKPGRRFFISYKELSKEPVHFHLYILSTEHGILSGEVAVKLKIGGELLCIIVT